MDNQPDGSSNGNPPERCPRPLYSHWDPTQEDHNYAHHDQVDKMEQPVTMDNQTPLTSPDRCPRPLYSRDSIQEDHNYAHHDQFEDLICLKVEVKAGKEDTYVRSDQSMENGETMVPGKEEEFFHVMMDNQPALTSPGGLYFRNNSERHLLSSQDKGEDSIARFSPRRNPITYNARHRPRSKDKPMDPIIPEVSSDKSHTVNSEVHLRSQSTNRSADPSNPKKSYLRRGVHLGNDSISCLGCGKSFTMTSELLIHLRSHTKVTYTCPECGESFTEKSKLLTHLRSHTDGFYSLSDSDDDLTLSQDGNTEGDDVGLYPPRNEGINHRSDIKNGSVQPSSGILLPITSTANNVFPCPQCGKYFRSKSRTVRHLMDVHTDERPYICSDCGNCYARKVHLLNHVKVHLGGRPFSCTACGKSFIKKELLIEHRSRHTGGRPFFCPICGESFRKKITLIEHERLHTGEMPFQCLDCGRAFRAKRVLKLHLETHLIGQPFSCSQCGKLFKYSISLNRHKKLHVQDHPLSCSECGKSFTTKYKLQVHIRSHTGKKIFQCSECEKSFLWKADLVSHQRVHTVEKPFFCSECGKNFSTKKVLEDHMKLHSNVRPFTCAVCGKSFKEQWLLHAHQVAHTGKRPFSCSECGKSCNRKCNLTRHQKIEVH